MTTRPARATTQWIAIDLIDEPDLAMRESMSDAGLQSLANSMRELGQLEPIGVAENGDRYRVIYGHRRRLAAALARLDELECKVYPAGIATEEAMKVAENADQEPVNPVGEATYYQRLFETVCNHDVEAVARFVRKPLSRIQDRFDLLRGDEHVRQALRDGRITHAVARELNKVKNDGYRRMFLEDAIRDGMNARGVRQRREQLLQTERYNELAQTLAAAPVAPSTSAELVAIHACAICLLADDEHEMDYVRVHRSCRQAHARSLRASAAGGGGRA